MTGGFQHWMALSLFGFVFPDALSGAQEPERSDSLRVELCDTTGLEPSLLQAARQEASDIFSTADAHLQWEGSCDAFPRTTQHSARIYVVPRIQEGLANWYYEHRGKRNVMGYFGFIDDIHEDVQPNGRGNRAAVIYVARQTVEAVAVEPRRISLTEALLARAMGRVFAHELAHRFLGPGHTRKGILKDFLDQSDLISRHYSGLFFSPEQIRVLRLRIEGQPP